MQSIMSINPEFQTEVSDCEWLLGARATPRLLEIAATMHERILEDARKRTISINIEKFTPWMCDLSNQDRLASLYNLSTDRIVTNRQTLIKLQDSLKGETGILELGIDDDIPTVIDTHVQPEFPQRYNAAIEVLFRACPWLEPIESTLVQHVLPVRTLNENLDRIGFSTHLLKGAMFFMFSPQRDEFSPYEIAIDVAHELGHQTLMLYLSCDRMISSSHLDSVFSGARGTSRDAIRSLHAAVALAYEMEAAYSLLRTKPNSTVGDKLVSFLHQRAQAQSETLSSLKETCEFTEFGEIFLADLQKQLSAIRQKLREEEKI